MSGPGHLPKGAGDGGGMITWAGEGVGLGRDCGTAVSLSGIPPAQWMTIICPVPPPSSPPRSRTACPSNGDQKETGGVYKEGKSAEDQGTWFIFQRRSAALLCMLMTHDPLKKKSPSASNVSFPNLNLSSKTWKQLRGSLELSIFPSAAMFRCWKTVRFWCQRRADLWPFGYKHH